MRLKRALDALDALEKTKVLELYATERLNPTNSAACSCQVLLDMGDQGRRARTSTLLD